MDSLLLVGTNPNSLAWIPPKTNTPSIPVELATAMSCSKESPTCDTLESASSRNGIPRLFRQAWKCQTFGFLK